MTTVMANVGLIHVCILSRVRSFMEAINTFQCEVDVRATRSLWVKKQCKIGVEGCQDFQPLDHLDPADSVSTNSTTLLHYLKSPNPKNVFSIQIYVFTFYKKKGGSGAFSSGLVQRVEWFSFSARETRSSKS